MIDYATTYSCAAHNNASRNNINVRARDDHLSRAAQDIIAHPVELPLQGVVELQETEANFRRLVGRGIRILEGLFGLQQLRPHLLALAPPPRKRVVLGVAPLVLLRGPPRPCTFKAGSRSL